MFLRTGGDRQEYSFAKDFLNLKLKKILFINFISKVFFQIGIKYSWE